MILCSELFILVIISRCHPMRYPFFNIQTFFNYIPRQRPKPASRPCWSARSAIPTQSSFPFTMHGELLYAEIHGTASPIAFDMAHVKRGGLRPSAGGSGGGPICWESPSTRSSSKQPAPYAAKRARAGLIWPGSTEKGNLSFFHR